MREVCVSAPTPPASRTRMRRRSGRPSTRFPGASCWTRRTRQPANPNTKVANPPAGAADHWEPGVCRATGGWRHAPGCWPGPGYATGSSPLFTLPSTRARMRSKTPLTSRSDVRTTPLSAAPRRNRLASLRLWTYLISSGSPTSSQAHRRSGSTFADPAAASRRASVQPREVRLDDDGQLRPATAVRRVAPAALKRSPVPCREAPRATVRSLQPFPGVSRSGSFTLASDATRFFF